MFNNGHSIYFPAITVFSTYGCVTNKEDILDKKKNFRFWDKDNGIYFYPFILSSAGHNHKHNQIELSGFDKKNNIIIGDSGGFQIATGVVEYSDSLREKIFNWLEENTNYAINLDLPPFVSSSTQNATESLFHERRHQTVENMKYFEKHQSGKTKYLNVLHGRNIDQLEVWYDSVKDFNFEGGWSIGSASHHIYNVLLSFFFLYSKGELKKHSGKKALFHILGFSKEEAVIVEYIQQKLIEKGIEVNITFDSSNPNLSSTFGSYYMFEKNCGKLTINKAFFDDKKNLDVALPCSCPVCRGVKFSDLLKFKNENGSFNSKFYGFLTIHNAYKMIQRKSQSDKIIQVGSKELNVEFFPSFYVEIFDIIDKMFEGNPLEVLEENRMRLFSYKYDFDSKDSENSLDLF